MYAATEIDLNDMPYAKGAWFDSEKRCLAGTREDVIQEISNWVNSDGDDVPRMFLLNGVAGSGKSAISHTVAQRFDELGRLGSFFCFDRAQQATRGPDIVFSTVARDLADLDPQRKQSLWQVIQQKRGLRTTRAVRDQFEKFILTPAADLTAIGPIVIVIDALDESGDQSSRRVLLSVLAEKAADLPSNFRILLTARAERDIQKALEGNQNVLCKNMDTMDAKSARHDISLFIDNQLTDINADLERTWPNKSWRQLLTDKSEGLFQWAFTACEFVKGDGRGGQDPAERLNLLVSSAMQTNKLNALDQLYRGILMQTFDTENVTSMDRFRFIMGRVLAAKEPLSILALKELCYDKDSIELVGLIIRPMGSLLSGTAEESVPVRPLHTSLRDFLTDRDRSGPFFIDISPHHHASFVLACLRVMRAGLCFNICKLETSHLRNSDVSDLKTRVEMAISPHLSYSCRFWADHLRATTFVLEIADEIRDFLHTRLLFWLEVLSLIKKVNIASSALLSIIQWSRVRFRVQILMR